MALLPRSFFLPFLWLTPLAALALGSCSCSSDEDDAADEGAVAGPGGGGAGGQPGQGGGPAGSGGSAGHADGGACATLETSAMPVDMLIMLDQSVSMNDPAGGSTKWQAVTGAIAGFVQSPQTDGMAVGIQYFGLPIEATQCPSTCLTDEDCGTCGPCVFFGGEGTCSVPGDSCEAADYAEVAVPIAPLPGNAQAVIDSMGMHSPSGGTPTSASMQGGIDFCKAWQLANPAHQVVHVYVTDGMPSECDTDIGEIAAIAAAGVGEDPSIRTFVIGVGAAVDNLADLASAGGTGAPYLVDQDANAAQQLLDALENIRSRVFPCEVMIPPPIEGMLDYADAEVQYHPGDGGVPQTFEHVPSPADCPPGGQAWHYDNNAAPTYIQLCEGACQTITVDTMAKLTVEMGCLD